MIESPHSETGTADHTPVTPYDIGVRSPGSVDSQPDRRRSFGIVGEPIGDITQCRKLFGVMCG